MPVHGYTYDERSGTLHPAPARVKPKPGHWRTRPRGRHRMAPLKRATPAFAADMRPVQRHIVREWVAEGMPIAGLSVRERVRMAVAAGILDAADAPQWAQPQ